MRLKRFFLMSVYIFIDSSVILYMYILNKSENATHELFVMYLQKETDL